MDLPSGDAGALHESLFEGVLRLDPALKVFPAHEYERNREFRCAPHIDAPPALAVPSLSCHRCDMHGMVKHVRRLIEVLRGMGRSREDAEDLIQEAFLVRTVRNLSVDSHRRAHRELYVDYPVETLSLADAAPDLEGGDGRTACRVVDQSAQGLRTDFFAGAPAWERTYMAPFRARSIARVRRELANVRVLTVPGAHDSFFLTSRAQVVQAMRRFLGGSVPRQEI
jgi:hypothetical protein